MEHSESTSLMPIGEVARHLAQADPTLNELVPPEIAAKYGVIPMSHKNGKLVVGVNGRLSSLAAYDLEVLTGCKVIAVQLGSKGDTVPDAASLPDDQAQPINPTSKNYLRSQPARASDKPDLIQRRAPDTRTDGS
jgi:hypothetical protein